MANDPSIIIGLATTGASGVVADLNSVATAAGEIDKSPAATSGDDLNSRMEALKKRTQEVKEGYRELGEETQKTDSKLRLGGASAAGAAIGGAVLAKSINEIGKGLASIDIENLRQLSPVMAAQVEQARGWAELLTDPINGIQRLISGTTIGEAFSDANDQLNRGIQMHQQHIQRLIEMGKENTLELERVAGRLEFLNNLAEESRKADVAAGKREDAKAGPDTPEKVKAGTDSKGREASRIVEEAAVQAKALTDALGPLKERLESAAAAARAAQDNVAKVEADPSAKGPDIDAARKNAAELSNKTGELAVELERQNQLLGEHLRQVTETGAGQIEELARQTGEAVTEAARTAIAEIKASGAADIPGAGSEALAGLEKLVSDSTPDSAQGGKLAGILQGLANNLTAKDAALATGVDKLIRIAAAQKAQYDALNIRIDELAGKVSQKN